jgi:hypothetical protein
MNIQLLILALILECKITSENEELSYIARGVVVNSEDCAVETLLAEAHREWRILDFPVKKDFSFVTGINNNGALEIVVGYYPD